MADKDAPNSVSLNTENGRVTFRLGNSIHEQIHAVIKKEAGKVFLEIEGIQRIAIHPRAANVVRVMIEGMPVEK